MNPRHYGSHRGCAGYSRAAACPGDGTANCHATGGDVGGICRQKKDRAGRVGGGARIEVCKKGGLPILSLEQAEACVLRAKSLSGEELRTCGVEK